MTKLDCPFCTPEVTGTLVCLSTSHPEYQLSLMTSDGTKKWFLCECCEGVFIRDKMTAKWQMSPATYDQFVKDGIIEDRLG